MAKGDSYKGLYTYFKEKKQDEIVLSFEEVEKIINRELPPSAQIHKEWWANDRTHSQAIPWLEAGYTTVKVSDTFEGKRIIFSKQSKL